MVPALLNLSLYVQIQPQTNDTCFCYYIWRTLSGVNVQSKIQLCNAQKYENKELHHRPLLKCHDEMTRSTAYWGAHSF